MIGSFQEGKTGQAFCGRKEYESNCFIGALKENSGYGGFSTSLAIRGSFLPLLGEVSYLFRGEYELGEVSYLFRGESELGEVSYLFRGGLELGD